MTTENNTESNHETITLAQQGVLFKPGSIVATPGAIEAMENNNVLSLDLLSRHLCGDWGVLPKEDVKANKDALKYGDRILSSYPLKDGERIWIITEADRSATTFLLPTEY
jgi:hypothetical protein